MTLIATATASVVVEPFHKRLSVESLIATVGSARLPAILESSLATRPYERYSIFACDPVDVFQIQVPRAECPFRALAERVASYPPLAGTARGKLPFCGGWIGFLTYEAGLGLEGIGVPDGQSLPLPMARFGLYDTVAIHDGWRGNWYIAGIDWPAGSVDRPPVGVRLGEMRARLEKARDVRQGPPPATPPDGHAAPGMSYSAYLEKVARAKRHIEAGNIYQVNLTQRFSVNTPVSPLVNYLRLRRASPSPRAAYLSWEDTAILSASPELFLDLHGRHVLTRPIKGTRPLCGDPETDADNRRALIHSEKDRAELNMIIDLLRNDLGRVCRYGSVRVDCADEIEAHPTVFHRVASIKGELRRDCDWVDLLRAAFPGGSITGAPKIRAMQIIAELEPTPRGVYCGSIGWIGLDGAISLSVAIRTMVQRGGRVDLHAGGAIVADSDPESEYTEILAKARGMFRALGCHPPGVSTVRDQATEH